MSVVSAEESHPSSPDDSTGRAPTAKRAVSVPTPEGWLLGIARDLGRVVRWASAEASVVGASARAAAATTGEVTRAMLRRRAKPEPAAIGGLLQRLDELLERHAPDGYEALRNDERLWRLLDELQTWRETAVAAAEAAAVAARAAGDDVEEEPGQGSDDDDEPAVDATVGDDPE